MVDRIDIEKALDKIASDEAGFRFQSLAVVLAKLRWPELIAFERHYDQGLATLSLIPSYPAQPMISKRVFSKWRSTIQFARNRRTAYWHKLNCGDLSMEGHSPSRVILPLSLEKYGPSSNLWQIKLKSMTTYPNRVSWATSEETI